MCILCVETATAAGAAAAIVGRRFSVWDRLAAWWNRHTRRTQNPVRKDEGSTPSAATTFCPGCGKFLKPGELVTAGVFSNDCLDPSYSLSDQTIAQLEAGGGLWHTDCYDGCVTSVYEGIAEEALGLCWEFQKYRSRKCRGVVRGDCFAPTIRCHQGCSYANSLGEPTLIPVNPFPGGYRS